MKRRIVSFLVILSVFFTTDAKEKNKEDFYRNFSDSTLRIDYTFGGGPDGILLFLDGQTKQSGWAGRHNHLKNTPLKGNGNILVLDVESGDTLYNNCFSTLFQEWLCTPEAQEKSMSFQNSFLVPLPIKEAIIKVSLRDNKHNEIASLQHKYKPDDELVRKVKHSPLPHKYVHKGNDTNAIDLAILAEGFTQNEMGEFLEAAEQISDEILKYEPFSSYKDKFNIVAVMTPSEESGVSIPLKDLWINTRYGSHFSTFYSDRYLTSPRVHKMHEDLEGIPYEYILMIVNTPEYGGGGIFNNYQIASSKNKFTLPVAVHEFGHSFGGLADEYDYGDDETDLTYPNGIEPWEPNITTLVDFQSKWSDKLTPGTPIPTPWEKKPLQRNADLNINEMPIGAYEGAGYRQKGIFRPSESCRMRDNYFPVFCKICEDSILETINFYTD